MSADNDHIGEELLATARTLSEALLAETFARDVVLIKQVGINPVVVHGGGPQIGAMLERLKIKSSFVDGLRVTDQETVEIVEMVLSGLINKQIVAAIGAAGGTAVGISGKDGRLMEARKLRRTKRDPDSNIEKILDLGFVGEPTARPAPSPRRWARRGSTCSPTWPACSTARAASWPTSRLSARAG
jgi:acetylglutamate kinase